MPSKIPFRVIHVAGQDDNYKAIELNSHSPTTKGWQSSRFCLYPQDIVIQLENRSRLRKIQILSHQFLIATKIEFYVGDVPDGIPVSLQNARYTRLGYIALSDNEKTGFKARELKSVHVDANGVFIKFVIHKNHINKHNLYNQVGIVALNVIGEGLDNDLDRPYPEVTENGGALDDPAVSGLYNKPDYISPLDDLAFDMYQDPEVAQIIRRLEHKKQEAVLQERYDFAKKLKSAIQDLQKVGEKLGKYEVEKRQAVENEDYDKAKLKKVQMDEYRLQVYKQLELYDMLELTGSRHPQSIDLEPSRQVTPPRLSEITVTPYPDTGRMTTPPPRTPYDERPLPAIKNKTPAPESEEHTPVPRTPRDERPLPATQNKNPAEDDSSPPEDTTGNVTGEPEQMSEKDQREAGIVVDTFGLPLASKGYSKTWSFREDALLEIYKQMSELSSGSKDEAKNMIKAAVFMINKAIKDKVHAVYTAGLNLLKMILTDFVPNHKISKSDITYVVEKTLPNLLQKIGETAPRNRETAKTFILDESKFPEVKPLHVVQHECIRPFKLSIAPRLALSRTEIVDVLYQEHGLQNSGLTVENLMKFLAQALQHTAGEVREKAEKIIIRLYKEVRDPVKLHLPPDDDRTRKNVLYKQLFEAFDKIDGKPSKEERKKLKQVQEHAKQQEIEDLQHQLQQLKDMAAGKAPVDENAIRDDKSKEKKDKRTRTKPNKAEPKASDRHATDDVRDDDASVMQIDHTCIFCNEKNEQFTEEGLDLHYWKSCPMLKRCSNCKQVVEIAGLTEHLLTECDNKDKFKKCSRCTEAVIDTEYSQHTAENTCPPSETGKNHCPLCHLNISIGEDAWKDHLMGPNGCKQNPRRGQGTNKGKGGNPPYKGKSRLPVKGAQPKTQRR